MHFEQIAPFLQLFPHKHTLPHTQTPPMNLLGPILYKFPPLGDLDLASKEVTYPHCIGVASFV